jgi:DNA modification methylase
MTTRLLVGDCRETLRTLERGSVQAAITSPPYYGLRDYGTPPLVWGGDAEHEHQWGDLLVMDKQHQWKEGHAGLQERQRAAGAHARTNGQNCPCGAWLGSLGLEPTPDLFVEHLVEVFREVRRVLRDDGVLWLNLGDSFSGSGNGAHDYRERNKKRSLSQHPEKYKGQSTLALQRVGPQEHTEGAGRVAGMRRKNMMLIPFRVALALQADGWNLRAHLPWLKRNCMPGSEKDRPTVSHEEVFLFTQRDHYYWDYEAVKREASKNTHSRGKGTGVKDFHTPFGLGIRANQDFTSRINGPVETRNWRTGDLFFDSWQGLMVDEDGDPLALVVNPAGFSEAHFATFPPKLVEPMIKASTRPGDTCLDPFGGAGTVGLVADRLQRNAILCELSDKYADMGTARIVGDSPMFSEVDVA